MNINILRSVCAVPPPASPTSSKRSLSPTASTGGSSYRATTAPYYTTASSSLRGRSPDQSSFSGSFTRPSKPPSSYSVPLFVLVLAVEVCAYYK